MNLLYYCKVIRGHPLPALLPSIAISFATRNWSSTLWLISHWAGSYIVEFDVPAYPGLYPSFLVFIPKPRPRGLGAFYKQLAATTLTGGFTSSFGYLMMGL